MEKIASVPYPSACNQLGRPGLNTPVGIYYPRYQSEPEYCKCDVREICEQKVIDVIFHGTLI